MENIEKLEIDKEETEQELKNLELAETTIIKQGLSIFDKLSSRKEIIALIVNKLRAEKEFNEQILNEIDSSIDFYK